MATHPTTCPLDCPDACGMLAETDASGALVKLVGNPAHPYSSGHLCGKTAIFRELQDSDARLVTPLVREGDRLVPATWDDALARIAERVAAVEPARVLSLGYAGNMGRLARKYPERVMNALGATATDGGVCDGEAILGHELVFGRAVGADLTRLAEAPALVVWGCDVARTLQHSLPRVRELCRAGKPVVVVDVHRGDTARRVERWGGRAVIVRPGSDAALLTALAREAFEQGCVDRDARAADCVGLDEYEASVRSGPTLDEAAAACGITLDEAGALHRLLATERAWVKAGIGWTRRRRGANAIRALACLVAVHGLEDRFHFESGDLFREHVTRIVRPDLRPAGVAPRVVEHVALGPALARGDYGAVFVWGHNPAVTLPDSISVRAGLSRDDCFVVVHELFLTETAALADVVLPAASFLEQTDVYTSYGHRCLQYTRRVVAPPGEARGNVDAFRAIGRALGLPEDVWRDDEEALARDLLAHLAQDLTGDDRARLERGEPVALPATPSADRGTPSGRIELVSEVAERRGGPRVPTPEAGDPPSAAPDGRLGESGRFQLHCAPSVHTHNSTYLHSPRHLARLGAPTCALHPDDARELGVVEGDAVTLSNARAALTLRARLSDDAPRGMVVVDGLFPSSATPEGLGLNALTGPIPGELGRGNSYYSTRVDVARAATPLAAAAALER